MSGAASLVDTLEGLGVSVSLTAMGKIVVEPASLIPTNLKVMLRAERDAVAQILAKRGTGEKTPETPETPENLTETPEIARCFSGVSENQTPETPERLPDGRLNAVVLRLRPGRCASCAHWQGPDEYGDGLCPLGRLAHGWLDGQRDAPVMTTALHECAAQAWTPMKGIICGRGN
ncbi:hypothetical protein [Deinococcus sp. Leaf326]|uniref:hypothetical protein n=1 Tax=Deinococcus sp. Leaf326 TaxID=1736338 RepID=UPI000A755E82|nr:hypothetical protein [Deinococcus sp. Leaf326]